MASLQTIFFWLSSSLSYVSGCIYWQWPSAVEEYDVLDLSQVGKAVESEWPSQYSCSKITMLAWPMFCCLPQTHLFPNMLIFFEKSHVKWAYLDHWKLSLHSLEFLECSYQDMCAHLIPKIHKELFMTYYFPRHMGEIKCLILLMLFLLNPFRTFWIWERSCFLEQFSFFWLFSKN